MSVAAGEPVPHVVVLGGPCPELERVSTGARTLVSTVADIRRVFIGHVTNRRSKTGQLDK